MNLKKEYRNKYLLKTSLVFLCILFLTVFFQNSSKPVNNNLSRKQVALQSYEIPLKDVLQLSSQQFVVFLVDKINFKIGNENLKILAVNNLINQRIIFFHKINLLIEPVSRQGFYYHYLSLETGDFPLLS
jgi:hypothetical protein